MPCGMARPDVSGAVVRAVSDPRTGWPFQSLDDLQPTRSARYGSPCVLPRAWVLEHMTDAGDPAVLYRTIQEAVIGR